MLAGVGRLDSSAAAFTERLGRDVVRALRSHGWLFAFAFGVAVACYGIRLFNMAFTLDEELQSVSSGADLAWIDDGREREQFVLNGPSMGLHLPPMVWGIQYKYTADAVLMVLASEAYDAGDYIRDYDEFLRLATGGS